MTDHAAVRKPKKEEREQLVEITARQISDAPNAGDLETARNLVAGAYIAVFADYATDSPGYYGKAMAVVWSGDPSFYEVYVWRNGKIERLDQDPGFRRG
ncbi:MAG: hypothetical protein M5R40_17025 [Anaerolineae bacterium]|nr:hypothetical protein [Anaerolineae bacterium]